MLPRHFLLERILELIRGVDNPDPPWAVPYFLSPRLTNPDTSMQEEFMGHFNPEMLASLERMATAGDTYWYPEHELIRCLEESARLEIPHRAFKAIQTNQSLYITFANKLLDGEVQVVSRTDELVFLKKVNSDTPLIGITREEQQILARVSRSTYNVRKSYLKRFPSPGGLCELIQLGVIQTLYDSVCVHHLVLPRENDNVSLVPNSRLLIRESVRQAEVRDKNIDDLFSTEKELEDLRRQEELQSYARWLSNVNGYVELTESTFELFEASECDECGGLCLLDSTLTVSVTNPEIIRKSNLFREEEIPPSGYEDDERSNDDGEHPIYCSTCHSEYIE